MRPMYSDSDRKILDAKNEKYGQHAMRVYQADKFLAEARAKRELQKAAESKGFRRGLVYGAIAGVGLGLVLAYFI